MPQKRQQWTGVTKGGAIGQRMLVGILSVVKPSMLYWILVLVVPFYMLFTPQEYKAIYTYFRNRFKKKRIQAFILSLKNYIIFGKIVLDKFAILSGKIDQFILSVENADEFNFATQNSEGLMLVSAHVGNFELAGYFFRNSRKNISELVFGGETKVIQQVRMKTIKDTSIRFIPISSGISHVFTIKEALDEGDIVAISCDRILGSKKTFACDFLGKSTEFPIGTFRIAASLNIPVFVAFIMKEKGLKYHGYVKKLDYPLTEKSVIEKSEQIGKQYVEFLEDILKKYPEQWFNYYDFWNEFSG